jgi:hypothetical protein
MGEKKHAWRIFKENTNNEDHLKDLRVDENLVLKLS